MRKTVKTSLRILALLAAVFLLLLLGYTAFTLSRTREAAHTLDEYQALYTDIQILQDPDGSVTLLPPESEACGTGIIFYQGMTVAPLAYVPLTAELTQAGYSVFIPRLPCNTAMLRLNVADSVMEQHPEIEDWYVAGHSMGGRCASMYASTNAARLRGVISVSSAVDQRLAATKLPLLLVYGDLDSVMGALPAPDALPEDTTVCSIAGANHAQFGDYGTQPMDSEAAIPAQEQQEQGASKILEWLSQQS